MKCALLTVTCLLAFYFNSAYAQYSSACGGSDAHRCDCSDRYKCDAAGNCSCQGDQYCADTNCHRHGAETMTSRVLGIRPTTPEHKTNPWIRWETKAPSVRTEDFLNPIVPPINSCIGRDQDWLDSMADQSVVDLCLWL
jgi:hypothetical protein